MPNKHKFQKQPKMEFNGLVNNFKILEKYNVTDVRNLYIFAN